MPEKKSDWKKLLKDVRQLEKSEILPPGALEKMKKESFSEASKLTGLLSEAWFVHDADVDKKKKRPSPSKNL